MILFTLSGPHGTSQGSDSAAIRTVGEPGYCALVRCPAQGTFPGLEYPRRRKICSAICDLELTVAVYDTTSIRDPRKGRQAALDAVVLDLSKLGATRLTIEQDDSLVAADRAYLYDAVRRHRAPDLVYHHCRPQEEPLLWVSDAVVWCYAKGGEWRRRVQPIIGSVTSVRV